MLKILFVTSIAVVAPGKGPESCREICVNSSHAFGSTCIKTLVCPSPAVPSDWKENFVLQGKAFLEALDGEGPLDSTKQVAIPARFLPVFGNFKSCVDHAFNHEQGNDCLRDLKRKSVTLL